MGGEEIKQYQKTLEALFSSLLESSKGPSGYALLDGDKKIPQVSQKYVKYLKLSCHELENLYLTNEVLTNMHTDWKSACEKVSASDGHGEKTEFLRSIKKWDKKEVECKSVINELSLILDSKHVFWPKRIGQVLGKGRPTGELADFLGDEIVNAIWNIN